MAKADIDFDALSNWLPAPDGPFSLYVRARSGTSAREPAQGGFARVKQYRRGAGRQSKSVQLVVQRVGSGRIKQFSYTATDGTASDAMESVYSAIAYVRLWHQADVQTALMDVRFQGNKGHDADVAQCPLWDP